MNLYKQITLTIMLHFILLTVCDSFTPLSSGKIEVEVEVDPEWKLWETSSKQRNVSEIGNYGEENKFSKKTFPCSRVFHQTYAIGDSLFVYAGNGVDGVYPGLENNAMEGDRMYLGDLFEFSIEKKMWRWINSCKTNKTKQKSGLGFYGEYGNGYEWETNVFPGARRSFRGWISGKYENTFAVYGGYGFASIGKRGFLSDIWYYNKDKMMWKWEEKFEETKKINNKIVHETHPGGRMSFLLWKVDTTIYIYGGLVTDEYSGGVFDFWKFEELTRNFTEIVHWNSGIPDNLYYGNGSFDPNVYPGTRSKSLTWVYGGMLYLFGGMNVNEKTKGDIFAYDLEKKMWRWVNTLKVKDNRQQGEDFFDKNFGENFSRYVFPESRDRSIGFLRNTSYYFFAGQLTDINYYSALWELDLITEQFRWVPTSDNETKEKFFAMHSVLERKKEGDKLFIGARTKCGYNFALVETEDVDSYFVFGGINFSPFFTPDLWSLDFYKNNTNSTPVPPVPPVPPKKVKVWEIVVISVLSFFLASCIIILCFSCYFCVKTCCLRMKKRKSSDDDVTTEKSTLINSKQSNSKDISYTIEKDKIFAKSFSEDTEDEILVLDRKKSKDLLFEIMNKEKKETNIQKLEEKQTMVILPEEEEQIKINEEEEKKKKKDDNNIVNISHEEEKQKIEKNLNNNHHLHEKIESLGELSFLLLNSVKSLKHSGVRNICKELNSFLDEHGLNIMLCKEKYYYGMSELIICKNLIDCVVDKRFLNYPYKLLILDTLSKYLDFYLIKSSLREIEKIDMFEEEKKEYLEICSKFKNVWFKGRENENERNLYDSFTLINEAIVHIQGEEKVALTDLVKNGVIFTVSAGTKNWSSFGSSMMGLFNLVYETFNKINEGEKWYPILLEMRRVYYCIVNEEVKGDSKKKKKLRSLLDQTFVKLFLDYEVQDFLFRKFKKESTFIYGVYNILADFALNAKHENIKFMAHNLIEGEYGGKLEKLIKNENLKYKFLKKLKKVVNKVK